MAKYNVLQHRASFSPWKKNNTDRPSIDSGVFFKWTDSHHFQSAYDRQYAHRTPQPPRDSALPGYGGYIPFVKPQELHAKRSPQLARQCLERLQSRPFNGLSSTGNNFTMDRHIDYSKEASSSKYGKSAIIKAHPGWRGPPLLTTTHDTYRHPSVHLNPTYVPTPARQQTKKYETNKSGYETNYNQHDRKGWLNHPVLNGDRTKSEYSRRFNRPVPLVSDTRKSTHRTPFLSEKGGVVD